MTGLFSGLFSLIVNVLAYVLPIMKANREVQESFFQFVQVSASHKMVSAKLMDSMDKQRKKLMAEWDKIS